jgi:hypothetical protein
MNKRLHRITFTFFCLFSISCINAQSKVYSGIKHHVFSPKAAIVSYDPYIHHLEAPVPGGDSYRGFLRAQRKKVAERFPQKPQENIRKNFHSDSVYNPIVDWGQRMYRVFNNGVEQTITGGVPNDNTMAISNEGILVSCINSLMYAYDTKGDSALFDQYTISLALMAQPFGVHHSYYDPKILYDPLADRFILTFLANNKPHNSFLVFAFSTTGNPNDDWNVYSLPGNPLDNNRWTDFPCMSITENEIIYTANLIIPDVSWQDGFDGSIIWQIDKNAGYEGIDSLPAKLWYDVRHDGKFIRNLHPVNGAEGITSEVYLLSNRNFDIENDTFFIAQLHGSIDDPEAYLTVKAAVSTTSYGLSPNGRQQNTDPNDSTDGLDINDSRVLGAFVESDNIQFVCNSVNPSTGLAAIYHGFIDDPGGIPLVTGNIIGHETRDFGYPNIAWTGQQPFQPQSIIGFNHTSPEDFAGVSAVFFSNDSVYSEIIELKEGENFVRRLSGTYDRWGDYFGIQRKYNQPEIVYAAGFYGLINNASGTWLNRLISPDTNRLHLGIYPEGNGAICVGRCETEVKGGKPPYQYEWVSHPDRGEESVLYNVCRGDTVILRVTDQRGTYVTDTIVFPVYEIEKKPVVYPNPFSDRIAVQFNLDEDAEVQVFLYHASGQIVAEIIRKDVKQGLNEFTFSTAPLINGQYILRGFADGKEMFVRKVIKQQDY